MDYADLIERALIEVTGSDASLAALLRGIDALSKSVPTFEELKASILEVQTRGRFPLPGWQTIQEADYSRATSENELWVSGKLTNQGVSPDNVRRALEWHSILWKKS